VTRRLLFHPLTTFFLSLTGGLVYALWARSRMIGDNLTNQYIYVVPIVVPFVAFMLDRVEKIGEITVVSAIVDVLVVGTAMMRVIGNVPHVSGHTLFLTYAVLRRGSLVTRLTAASVLIETIYLKYFVWHDFITSTTGIALGLIALMIMQRFGDRVAAEGRVSA
jgi:hypothetical protein